MSNLREAVLVSISDQGNEEEQKGYMEDVMGNGCSTGVVGDLVYYSQTHDWFDKYYSEISALVEDYESDTGTKIETGGDVKNAHAWFSYEETLREIYEEKYGAY